MAQAASLPSAPLVPPPAAAAASSSSACAASSWSSVLGKRSSRASHLIFLPSDRSDPLDFSDFEQVKLPAHSLLYLVAAAQPVSSARSHASTPLQQQQSTSSLSQQAGDADAAAMQDDECGSGKEEKREEKSGDGRRNGGHGGHILIPVLPPVIEADEEEAEGDYDSISKLGDGDERGHSALGHAAYHRLHRSLAAAQRVAAAAAASSPQQRYKVMEFSCREPLHILHINAQQREAIAAAAADHAVAPSSLDSDPSSPSPSAVQPPPLLCYLLSSHNDCVGYDCAEAEGGSDSSVVLTRDCCDSLLLLLDDDRQSGLAQQLLTDMFARISLRK